MWQLLLNDKADKKIYNRGIVFPKTVKVSEKNFNFQKFCSKHPWMTCDKILEDLR